MSPLFWAVLLTVVYYYTIHHALYFRRNDPVPFVRIILGRNVVLSIYTISAFTHGLSLFGWMGLKFVFVSGMIVSVLVGLVAGYIVQQLSFLPAWIAPSLSMKLVAVISWNLANNTIQGWKALPEMRGSVEILCNCFFVFCFVLEASRFLQKCNHASVSTAIDPRMHRT